MSVIGVENIGKTISWKEWLTVYDISDDEESSLPNVKPVNEPRKFDPIQSVKASTLVTPTVLDLPLSYGKFYEVPRTPAIDDTLVSTVKIFKQSGVVQRFKINEKTLLNWLTVVKEYSDHDHPYHNWSRVLSVTNRVSTVIDYDNYLCLRLTSTEKLVLLMAAVCHEMCFSRPDTVTVTSPQSIDEIIDLHSVPWDDFTNMECLIETLYDHQGCNIFENLSADHELDVMNMISYCMSATDLDVAYERCKTLMNLIVNNRFSWYNSKHKELFRSMTLTMCSLSVLAEPWDIHLNICKAVVNDAVFRRLPKHPEKAHANTCCEMVRIFHQVFKDLIKVHHGFKNIYKAALKNYNKWLEVIAQGQYQFGDSCDNTSSNKDLLPDQQDVSESPDHLNGRQFFHSLILVAPAPNSYKNCELSDSESESVAEQQDKRDESRDTQKQPMSMAKQLFGKTVLQVTDLEGTVQREKRDVQQELVSTAEQFVGNEVLLVTDLEDVDETDQIADGVAETNDEEPLVTDLEDVVQTQHNNFVEVGEQQTCPLSEMKPKKKKKKNFVKKITKKLLKVKKQSTKKLKKEKQQKCDDVVPDSLACTEYDIIKNSVCASDIQEAIHEPSTKKTSEHKCKKYGLKMILRKALGVKKPNTKSSRTH